MIIVGSLFPFISTYIFPILSYIGEVFCALSVIFIMICFLGREGEVTKYTFLPGAIYVGLVTILNAIFRGHNLNILFVVLFFIVTVITAFFTFTSKRVINCLIACLMIFMFETYISCEMIFTAMYFSEAPREFMRGFNGMDGYLGSGFSGLFIFSYLLIMLVIFLSLYFGMIRNQRTMYIGWKYRILFILWEILVICTTYVPVMGANSHNEQIHYMQYELGVIMLSMGIVVPILMITVISRRYALEKTALQEDYISAELDYINQYKKNQTETRAFRHDIINNLSMLSVMHEEKKFDEIEEYLSTLLNDISSKSSQYITGDEMLNCIIGMKSSKMEEEGISFTLDGAIEGGLGIKPVDICSIFANALDNAIEACENIEDDDRWISMSLENSDKAVNIKLKNAISSEEQTKKKDLGLHGSGMHNIKTTISKYGGTCNSKTEDGEYTLSISISKNN